MIILNNSETPLETLLRDDNLTKGATWRAITMESKPGRISLPSSESYTNGEQSREVTDQGRRSFFVTRIMFICKLSQKL